jgi:hypothetical protein
MTMHDGEDLDEVIAQHVRARHAAVPGRRTIRDRVQSLMSLPGRGGGPEESAEDVFALLSLVGIEDELRDEVSSQLGQAEALGVEFDEALPIIQAYSRGVTASCGGGEPHPPARG